MARQDIQMDSVYGDMVSTDNIPGRTVNAFHLLEDFQGPYGETVLYASVTMPGGFDIRFKDGQECCVRIPYLPFSKPLYVRFCCELAGGHVEYLWNTQSRDNWFPVVFDSGEETIPIKACELFRINGDGVFIFCCMGDHVAVYSGAHTDMIISTAKSQNEVFLLKAFTGNIYQHPTTGVGLIEFLHGNFENTGLAAKLQTEFENDKMVINNAYMDSSTGELLLDVIEKDG